MKDLLTGLNERQRQAVVKTEGPLLVLAGAGSGKTRALTHRIAYLIEAKGVKPWNILALTFTNKAAEEMRQRVEDLTGYGSDQIWMSTFHSACVRILRRHAEDIGYTRQFSIYDSDDQRTLMKQVVKKLDLDPRMYRERALLTVISGAKNELITAGEFSDIHGNDFRMAKTAEIYREYQAQLLSNNAMDFDDLLVNTVMLFRKVPDILREWQERFHYILVDEYQDTNTAQFQLVSMLAAEHRNLCVVGDDDQSIYKFRGANIRNIQDFEKVFPDAEVVKLEQNYRSTGQILSVANQVIRHNTGRKEKVLWTENGEGIRVSFRQFDTAGDEADGIIRDIIRNRGDYGYGDCAVLYRTNAQSRLLEERCVANNVPYRLVGGVNFYQRKEIKDLICYLKTIDNGRDDVAVQRIINVPRRGIGAASIGKVMNHAEAQGKNFFDALCDYASIPGLGRSASKISEFVSQILEFRAAAESMPVKDLLEMVLEKTGYREELEAEDSVEAQTRLENIQELVNKAADQEGTDQESGSLSRFLEEVALVAEVDSLDSEEEKVILMTLHSAKGLEFPKVYLSGMEDGLFPGMLSINSGDPDDLEEERRLCYVGITRAKEVLILTAARQRMINGETRYSRISRFVEEIPGDMLQGSPAGSRMNRLIPGNREFDKAFQSSAERDSGSFGSRPGGYRPKPTVLSTPGNLSYKLGREFAVQKDDHLEYSVGDRVSHVKFGTGKVLDIKEGKRDYEVTVLFDNDHFGEKQLFASFAKLKKI